MSATEELRRMLDERGVPWKDYGYENHTWWGEWHAENRPSVNGLFLKVEGVVTPEQAIAATLGRGMLTADDVRDLIERHSDASGGNGRDFHNGAYVAIADELNATLGAGTCHDEGDPGDFCCSECGVRMFTNTSDTYTMIASDERTIIKHPNFCPNCGAKIVGPTTNDVDAEVDDG